MALQVQHLALYCCGLGSIPALGMTTCHSPPPPAKKKEKRFYMFMEAQCRNFHIV